VSVFDEFKSIVKSPHKFAIEWKERTGGKVLGYLCTNISEELAYAAGVLPVRLLGSNEPESVSKAHIFQAAFCSFCRDCFAQAINGKYDYIDGVMYGVCCMHARQVYQGWEKHMPVSFRYELHVPGNIQSPHAKKYLMSELEDCRNSLAEWTGKDIANEDIDRAIEIYNRNRRLMSDVYDLFKKEDPPVAASEVAEMAISGMLIDKETHNGLLEKALEEISQRGPAVKKGNTRIMLLGSVNNDIELFRLFESCGAHVVTDDYCTGNRYYRTEVIPGDDRIAALADRLINKTPCPLKDLPERRRLREYSRMISDFNVQGVIYSIQRMCDSHGLDYPEVEKFMNKKGIPMLKLELDYSVPIGQFRTRIEAFLEMIESA